MVQGKCALRRRHALFLASLTALAGSHALAASTTYNYTGAAGDGNYFTPANWTPAGPPTTTNSDIGNISAGTFVVTANGTIGANGTTSPTIFLGNGTYNDTLLYNSFYGGNGALENAVVGNAVTNINPYVSSVSSYLYEANTAVGTGIEIASGSVINVASPASDDSLTVDSVTVKTGGILENTGVGIMRLAGLITNNGLVQTTGSAVISLENGGSMTSSGGVVGQFNVGAGTSVLITGAGSANTYTLNTIATTNNGTIDLNAFNFLVGNSRPKQLIVNGGSFTNNGTFNLRLTRPYFDFTGQSDTATASIGATTGGVATTFTNTGHT